MDDRPPDPSSIPPEQSPGWSPVPNPLPPPTPPSGSPPPPPPGWNPVPPPPGMAPPPPGVPPPPGWNSMQPPGTPPPVQQWAQPPPQPPYAQPPAQPGYPQPPYGAPPPGYPPPGYGYPQPVYAAAGGGTFGGFWIRFVAALIDTIIIGIPYGVIIAASGAISCTSTTTIVGGLGGGYTVAPVCTFNPAIQLLSIVVGLLYFVGMWATGATLGQRALGLHVVDQASGANIGFGRAFVRYVGYIIAALPFGLGLIWAGFDQRKQGWHDKIAGTVVVRR